MSFGLSSWISACGIQLERASTLKAIGDASSDHSDCVMKDICSVTILVTAVLNVSVRETFDWPVLFRGRDSFQWCFTLMADICRDGEARGWHAGNDFVEHARSTHRTHHAISHLSGCYTLCYITCTVFAFCALTLLFGLQEEHPSWRGYLSRSKLTWFAYGSADAIVTAIIFASLKSRMAYFLVSPYQHCPGKEPLKRASVFWILKFHKVV